MLNWKNALIDKIEKCLIEKMLYSKKCFIYSKKCFSYSKKCFIQKNALIKKCFNQKNTLIKKMLWSIPCLRSRSESAVRDGITAAEKKWAKSSYVQLHQLREVHKLVEELQNRLRSLKITPCNLQNPPKENQTTILKVGKGFKKSLSLRLDMLLSQ